MEDKPLEEEERRIVVDSGIRVKVGYSMPLWLKQKIDKESSERKIFRWKYIASMIRRAESCAYWEKVDKQLDWILRILDACGDYINNEIKRAEERNEREKANSLKGYLTALNEIIGLFYQIFKERHR
jgi:hypothetical protein